MYFEYLNTHCVRLLLWTIENRFKEHCYTQNTQTTTDYLDSNQREII
ncbi:hypothetical protein Hjap01_03275 [Haloarcula japonica]